MNDLLNAIIDIICKDYRTFKNFCKYNDPVDIVLTILNYNYWKLIKRLCLIIVLVIIYIYMGGINK